MLSGQQGAKMAGNPSFRLGANAVYFQSNLCAANKTIVAYHLGQQRRNAS
jgi:hypothetical protein